MPLSGAGVIPTAVDGDSAKPGAEGTLSPEGADGSPGLEKGFLGDIRRILGGGDGAQCHVVDQTAVPIHQNGERVIVARGGLSGQGKILDGHLRSFLRRFGDHTHPPFLRSVYL